MTTFCLFILLILDADHAQDKQMDDKSAQGMFHAASNVERIPTEMWTVKRRAHCK